MIFTNYYYNSRLEKEEYRIRDNRFYPGKSFECFKLWFDYIRIHYPNEHILIFDNDSPITIQEGMAEVGEDYEIINFEDFKINRDKKVHVISFKDQLPYFHAVSRNIFSAIKWCYNTGEDLFWLDTDFLINSNLHGLIGNLDFWSDNIDEFSMTAGMVALFVSNKQLHKYDNELDLIESLDYVLQNGGYHARMFSFFEHGLYNLFCFGNYGFSNNLNGTHMSCFENFVAFLEKNPINTTQYNKVLNLLKTVNLDKLKNIEMKFLDTYYEVRS